VSLTLTLALALALALALTTNVCATFTNPHQELCSLANEMGQPDLIYRFMDLANNQAAMATKRGAAFGFASIAKLASAELAAHVPVLVPKLYRMQFDPNPKVQEAMQAIWQVCAFACVARCGAACVWGFRDRSCSLLHPVIASHPHRTLKGFPTRLQRASIPPTNELVRVTARRRVAFLTAAKSNKHLFGTLLLGLTQAPLSLRHRRWWTTRGRRWTPTSTR
jgi:hypothetical protein